MTFHAAMRKRRKPIVFHFTAPPADKPWAKAIARLNEDREIYEKARRLSMAKKGVDDPRQQA